MDRSEQGWKGVWLTPLGLMVMLLVLTLGTTTWLTLEGVRQRDLLIEQEARGQLRDEALHQKTADLLECIVTSPADLRNPALHPDLRKATQEFLDQCFEDASVQADREVPPLDE